MLKFLNVRQTPEEGGGRRYWTCTIQEVSLSVLLLVRCAFPAPSLNSRLCFARSRVSPVLWILCRPANMFPAQCLWCVCVCVLSHSLTSIHFNLAPPLLAFFSPLTLLPLSPGRLSSGRSLFFFFLLSLPVAVVFLSACCQRSALSAGVLGCPFLRVHPQCHSSPAPIAFSSASPDFVFSPSSQCFSSCLHAFLHVCPSFTFYFFSSFYPDFLYSALQLPKMMIGVLRTAYSKICMAFNESQTFTFSPTDKSAARWPSKIQLELPLYFNLFYSSCQSPHDLCYYDKNPISI